jgi:hypothetical protein
MRASSPPVAIYKTPLKGMDAREVKPQDAPNLLFNIDLSNRGFWKERPGVKPIVDYAVRTGGAVSILGTHATRVDGTFHLIVVYANEADGLVYLSIIDELGVEMFSGYPSALRGEPLTTRHRYSFVTAGRFVYFCNGYGKFWELEIRGVGIPTRIEVDLEEGNKPLILSYIDDSISPASLSYFYEQIVISGFRKSREVTITKPSEPPDPNAPWPPSEVLNTQKDKIRLDPGCVFVSEPGLWRSYPIEDPSGFYWVYNEDIIASAGAGTNLLLFGSKRVYSIIGHGSSTQPRRTRLAELSIAGPQAICYFDRYVFFVANDGCYLSDGNSVTKISFEMDPLWFGRETPETTRYVEQKIQKTAYPFHVNRLALRNVTCINDRARQQVMVCLPANDSPVNNMVWVYNYSDMLEGMGSGKWSIWAGEEEPTFTGTSLSPSSAFPPNPSSPTQSNTTNNLFHWSATTSDHFEGNQRIFAGTDRGLVLEFGITRQDWETYPTYRVDGAPLVTGVLSTFPVVASLGRIGRVDSDGRIICTDVAVRKKQLTKNVEDNPSASKLITVVRSEGEGLKHFDVSEADVEFQDTILNSQQGVSENTKSVLNTMVLGASPTGSNAPLMNSEYFEAYARVNVPDEEGRSAYVDLYSEQTTEPHRLQISEVRVYANIKGGSQREQS